MSEGVAEGDARRSGFDELAGACAIEHARLGSHVGNSFYTGGGEKEGESRKLKESITRRRRGPGALSGNCESIRSAGGQEGWEKRDSQEWLSQKLASLYFLAELALAAASAYFLVKRSTRPAVSTSFCLPVKKGWQLEQISTRSISPLMVERVWKVWPQAQCTVTG